MGVKNISLFLCIFLFSTECFSSETINFSRANVSVEDMIGVVKSYSEHCYNGVINYWRDLYDVRIHSDKILFKRILKSFDVPESDESCCMLLSELMQVFTSRFASNLKAENCSKNVYITFGNEALKGIQQLFHVESVSKEKIKRNYAVICCLALAVVVGCGLLFAQRNKKIKSEKKTKDQLLETARVLQERFDAEIQAGEQERITQRRLDEERRYGEKREKIEAREKELFEQEKSMRAEARQLKRRGSEKTSGDQVKTAMATAGGLAVGGLIAGKIFEAVIFD